MAQITKLPRLDHANGLQSEPARARKKQIQVSKLLSPEALKHETHNSISVTKRRPDRNPYPELRSCLPPLWAVPQPKRPGLCVPGFGPPLRLNLRKLLKAQSSADEASGPKLNAWGFPLNHTTYTFSTYPWSQLLAQHATIDRTQQLFTSVCRRASRWVTHCTIVRRAKPTADNRQSCSVFQ